MIASYQYRLNNWQNIISNVIRSLHAYSDILLHGTRQYRHSLDNQTVSTRGDKHKAWWDYNWLKCWGLQAVPSLYRLYCIELLAPGSILSHLCRVLAGPGQWWSVYLVLTPGTQETAWLVAQPSFSPGAALDSAGVNIQPHITPRVSWLSTLHHVTDRW